ncbi:MAG: type II CAAX prenyl endopeptidase Rce1 family protein [Armatimonadota bacterium]
MNTKPHRNALPLRQQLKRLVASREFIVSVSGLVFLVLEIHHRRFGLLPPTESLFEWHISTVTCLFVAPVIVCVFLLDAGPKEFGLQNGDHRVALRYMGAYALVVIPAIVLASRLPSFQRYYPIYRPAAEDVDKWLISVLSFGVYFFVWEFFFRGYLLFGLAKRFGPYAIIIQTIPFTLVHLGKPEPEVFAAIVAGLALGLMAYHSRSMLPCFILHWFCGTLMDALVIFGPTGS